MTNKEAYLWIVKHQRLFTFNCEDVDCSSTTNKAIEALYLQIPKTPKLTQDPYQWHCPNCNSIIGVDGQEFGTNYCCDCGQRLDWGE